MGLLYSLCASGQWPLRSSSITNLFNLLLFNGSCDWWGSSGGDIVSMEKNNHQYPATFSFRPYSSLPRSRLKLPSVKRHDPSAAGMFSEGLNKGCCLHTSQMLTRTIFWSSSLRTNLGGARRETRNTQTNRLIQSRERGRQSLLLGMMDGRSLRPNLLPQRWGSQRPTLI